MIINFANLGGGGGGSYTLPVAGVGDNGILGGVKVDGETISIDSNGVISAEAGVDPEEYLEAQQVISEALNDLNTRMGDVNNALNLI